jgi:hypothetical protein
VETVVLSSFRHCFHNPKRLCPTVLRNLLALVRIVCDLLLQDYVVVARVLLEIHILVCLGINYGSIILFTDSSIFCIIYAFCIQIPFFFVVLLLLLLAAIVLMPGGSIT